MLVLRRSFFALKGENMRQLLEPDEWADVRGDIFVLYGELGITEERERHRLQHALTGCSSLRFMTHEEHHLLIHTLERLNQTSVGEQQKMIHGLLALSSFEYRKVDT